MKIKELFKQSFWISFFVTISASLLASLLGASTFWAVIVGLIVANTVNAWMFFRKPKQISRDNKLGLPSTEQGL